MSESPSTTTRIKGSICNVSMQEKASEGKFNCRTRSVNAVNEKMKTL